MKCRFAPSPTGYLHAGNARTAILNWLWARHYDAEFMLRIDDTDTERSSKDYEDSIRFDLQWLGIHWDIEARQSDRLDIYHHALETLKAKNLVYPCYETADELALKRKLQLNQGKPPVYDRTALSLTPAQIAEYENEGRKPHWRFQLDQSKIISWHDIGRGDVAIHSHTISDPVLMREDGRVLYTLSSVVDDGDFAMTHIVRGGDHVVNSAAQIQLFDALDYPIPTFAHVPLLNGHDGQKLSKRHGKLGLKELRDDGLDPTAIALYLAQLGTATNITAGTSLRDYARIFDFGDYGRANPRFHHDELWRLHQETIRHHDYDYVKHCIRDYITPIFWQEFRENINDIDDIHHWWQICYGDITPIIDHHDKEILAQAAVILEQLSCQSAFDKSMMQDWNKRVADVTGRKGKDWFMPLRLALTGQDHGPQLDKLIVHIGVDKTIARLKS